MLDSPVVREAVIPSGAAISRPLWRDWAVPLSTVLVVLAAKALFIQRINVNWDEFYFLSHVHSLVRGELEQAFQTAYTHLFTWLTRIGGDEMSQIVAARAVMVAFLAVTAVLVAKLTARWVPASTIWVAPLCFLATSHVMRHGGSFRADSLLAPLTVAALLLVTSTRNWRMTIVAAGACIGVATALSVKAGLILPTTAALILAGVVGHEQRLNWSAARDAFIRLVLCFGTAALVTGILLLAHRWSLPVTPEENVQGLASSAFHKVLVEVPLFPRWDYFLVTLKADKGTWLLMLLGVFAAFRQRNWTILSCALPLILPVLLYRNAYSYYYVVMLAPASVLAAYGVEEARRYVARRSRSASANWVPVALCIPLVLQAFVHLSLLRRDEQAGQRATIAAVHRTFPQPVPYIDHSGMIASFRKVNYFMSTWGTESYLQRGTSFMREAIAHHRPPLLLANRAELVPGTRPFSWLLPEDQELIQRFYVPYWGVIRVAGTLVQVAPGETVSTSVPFPGRYRLEATGDMLVNGEQRSPGEVLDLRDEPLTISSAETDTEHLAVARLVWAEAVPPPPDEPLPLRLYTGF